MCRSIARSTRKRNISILNSINGANQRHGNFLSFFNSHASFKTSSPIRTSKKRTSNHATATTSTPQWHAPSRHTAPEPMLQRSDYYPEQVNLRKYIFKLNSTNQRTRDARPVPFRRNAQVTVFYSLSRVQIAPLFVCSREV